MTRPLLRSIATALLCLGALSSVAADEAGADDRAGAVEAIVVRAPADAVAEVAGGTTVQRAITVENASSEAVTIEVDLATPEGIRSLGELAPRIIPAGSWDVFPLAFHVSATAPARTYRVVYAVYAGFADARRGLVSEGVLQIEVASMPRLEIEIREAPAFAAGRTRFAFGLVISNTGNVPLDLLVDYQSSGRSSLVDFGLPEQRLPLAVGETRGSEVVFLPPADLDRLVVDRIEVRAADQTWGVGGRASTTVELVPASLSWRDGWIDYPLRLDTGAEVAMDDAQWGATVSTGIYGSSPIGSTDDRVLELDLRKSAEVVPFSVAEHPDDRYSVRYVGPALEVDLGDRVRSVSPLVQPQERTRGASVLTTLGQIRAGLLIQEASGGPTRTGLLTASAGFASAEGWSVDPPYAATLSATTAMDGGAFADDLTVSLNQSYSGPLGFSVDGEVATSIVGPRLIDASGVRASARFEQPVFDASLSGHLVGPAFPGRLTDGYSLSLATVVRPQIAGLRVDAFSGVSRYEPVPDEATDASPFRGESGGSVSYQRGRLLAGGAVTGRIEAGGFLGPVTSTTRRARVEAGLSGDLFSFEAETAFVTRSEYPGATRKNGVEALLSVDADAGRSDFVSTLGFRQADLSAPPATATVDVSIGADHSADRFQIAARANAAIPVETPRRYALGFSLESALLVGRSGVFASDVSADYDGASEAAGWERFSLALSYSTSVEVAYARRSDVGAVGGRLVDTVAGEAVAGAVVRLGDQATVTDSAGRYEFPAVPVGEHRLAPDSSSIPAGRLVRQGGTLVDVRSRESVETDVELVAGHSITGTFVTVTPTAAAAVAGESPSEWRDAVAGGAARSVPVAGARVTVSNGEVFFVDYTDETGAFSFTALEPGTWEITLPRTAERSRVEVIATDASELADGARLGAAATEGTDRATVVLVLADASTVALEVAEIVERAAPRMLEGSTLSLPEAP